MEAPRYAGFVRGNLTKIDTLVDIPTKARIFQIHQCFGYRALEQQFSNLSEFFESVTALCGTSTLDCPALTPPAGPEKALAQLPSWSLESNTERVIDRTDLAEYAYSDDLADILDQISDQGVSADGPTTAGVSLRPTSLPHQLIDKTSVIIHPYPARQASPADLSKYEPRPCKVPFNFSDRTLTHRGAAEPGGVD